MSGREAGPEVDMPQQLVYGEDYPGVGWQVMTIVILSWAALIGGVIAIALPHLAGLGAPLFVIGGFFALIYTVILWFALGTGFRVYEDSIQIGGLRSRDRRLRRGTWPPKKLSPASRKAVFTCPWQAADGLYLLTERQDIKRIRQDARRFRKRTDATKMPLGVLDSASFFAAAILLISNNPDQTASEPREFRPARGQSGPVWPVPSPTWLVPVRNPSALHAALRQLPQAPPLYDRLPAGHVRFEASQ
jgi:hypothetical protein